MPRWKPLLHAGDRTPTPRAAAARPSSHARHQFTPPAAACARAPRPRPLLAPPPRRRPAPSRPLLALPSSPRRARFLPPRHGAYLGAIACFRRGHGGFSCPVARLESFSSGRGKGGGGGGPESEIRQPPVPERCLTRQRTRLVPAKRTEEWH